MYVQAVTTLFESLEPTALLALNSVNGLDYFPAVATLLELPLTTDAVDLAYDGCLEVTREMYGSKVETTVEMTEEPFTVSVRGGEWPAAGAPVDPLVESSAFAFDLDANVVRSRVTGFEEVGGGDVDTAAAASPVSVGRGTAEETVELIDDLGDAPGATLSSP